MLLFELPHLGEVKAFFENGNVERFSKRQLITYIKKDDCKKGDRTFLITEIPFELLSKQLDNIQSMSRQFLINQGELFYREYKIYASQEGNIIIEYLQHSSFSKKEFLSSLLNREKEYELSHSRFYSQFLFPVFMLYAITGGYFLLHGSLLSYRNKILLISGIDGVGKSSLATILASRGATVLSDNYVLFNGNDTIPLSLTLRLPRGEDTQQGRVIYRDKRIMEVTLGALDDDKKAIDEYYWLYVGDELRIKEKCMSLIEFVMVMNNAPEINEANTIVSPFVFLRGEKIENVRVPVRCLGIPRGELQEGAEII